MNAEEPGEPTPPASRARSDGRTLLAIAGPVLFTPPAMALADRDFSVSGVPAVVVYVFLAWFVGILLTRWLARSRREGR
ncbi:hypothetical protein [Acuticoccus mangrovi]|uniref:Uncharacterized protein n=1 Tax=Acuticoccus mangrovi TaxID=2796142 RepID=A0A934IMF9_9HYPH|nr:hypothetical protein [Acuticoccus mangrovi]MBJ3774099.1 hypothetical protein [Acuticoccus mangrovi]